MAPEPTTLAEAAGPSRQPRLPAPASEYLPACDSMSGDQFAAYLDVQQEEQAES
jgi:hypothetical protein